MWESEGRLKNGQMYRGYRIQRNSDGRWQATPGRRQYYTDGTYTVLSEGDLSRAIFGDTSRHLRSNIDYHLFMAGADRKKEDELPVTCAMCGNHAAVAFRNVGDEVKVECPTCGLYETNPEDLKEISDED